MLEHMASNKRKPSRAKSGKKTMNLLTTNENTEQSGINMVDLMMWLVIAALLLATAIQSIGYYQKNANVYQMKTEADVVASRIMAASSERGSIDPKLVDAVVAEENAARPNDSTVVTWGSTTASASAASENSTGMELVSAVTATSVDSAYFLKVTNTNVPDSDVVYFLEDSADHSTGVHVVSKDALGSASGPPENAPVNGTCYNGQWKATYFTGYFATVFAEKCENGEGIDKAFGEGAPLPGMPVDYFAIRWEKTIKVDQSRSYTITARGDDAMAVWVNGSHVLTSGSTEGTKSATFTLPAGNHKLKVEINDGVRNSYAHFTIKPTT